MQKNWSKRILQLMLVLLMVLAFLFFMVKERSNLKQATSPVANLVAQVDNVLSLPFRMADKMMRTINNLLATYQENEQLKSSLSSLKNQEQELTQVTNENQELRAILEMKERLVAPQKISAQVIVRSPQVWLDELRLNVGQDKEVTEKMLVVSDKGLLGRVSQVSATTSQVTLLTTQNSTLDLPIKWQQGENIVYAILSNYDPVEKTFLITDISRPDDLEIGAEVLTSGLDGETVAEVPVGQLVSVDNQKRQASVKAWADFSDISMVTLVGR